MNYILYVAKILLAQGLYSTAAWFNSLAIVKENAINRRCNNIPNKVL